MQVITIDGVRNGEGRLARIGVIGSCRVHGPIKALVASGEARGVAFPFNTYTHSPYDALQYLRFCMGHVVLPPPLEPLVFGKTGMRYPALGFVQLVGKLDLVVAEVSSQTRLSASGFEVQQNYFATNFVRPGGKPVLDWWRSVVRQDEQRHAAGADLIEQGLVKEAWQREVVRTIELEEIGDEAFTRAMTELMRSHSARWLFVSHFSFDRDRTVASRERNIALLQAFAASSGAGFFDPSPVVQEAGASNALKGNGRDIYHYSAAFETVMGQNLADCMRLVMDGQGDQIDRLPPELPATPPDRTMLDDDNPDRVNERLQVAESVRDGKLAHALRHRLLQLDDSNVDAALGIARVAAARRQWRSAVVYADHVLALDDRNTEALNIRLQALDELGEGDPVEAFQGLMAEGDLEKISVFCRRIHQRLSKNHDVHLLVAEVIDDSKSAHEAAMADGDVVQACAALDRLAALDVDRSDEWKSMRHAQIQNIMSAVNRALESGDSELALAHSRTLIQIGVHVAESNLLVGRLLLERGELNKAIQALTVTAELQPDRPWAWINLARARQRGGDIVGSADAYLAAGKLAEESGEAQHLDEARNALRSMATALLLKAREIEAASVTPAGDLEAMHVYRLTAAALADDVRLAPMTDTLRRRSLLRVMELHQAADPSVVEAIKAHLEMDPDCVRVLGIAGRHYMDQRDYEQALGYWERLRVLEPDRPRHHLQAARCMDWLGMTDGMLAAANRCLELDPDIVEARSLAAKSSAMVAELE